MGKMLIINGADFSGASLPPMSDVEYTSGELLTTKGYYSVTSNDTSVSGTSAPTGQWRCAILPINPNMYIGNATAVSLQKKDDQSLNAKIPALIFLSSNNTSGFIQGSEVYPLSEYDEGVAEYFGTFSGFIHPPVNATHVIINTNLSQGGNLDSIISWNE